LLQLIAFFSASFEIWFALRLFGHPVDASAAIMLESMTQAMRHLAFVVPAGLGVQEGMFVLFGHVLGMSGELALAVSMAKRLREVLCGVPALISWQLAEASRIRTAPSNAADPAPAKRFLIVTADDFGIHEAVNEAVSAASRSGVLTAASLMVGAPAAADAVRRARELPQLRVGLHLVLADGFAVLPREVIPDLVDENGRFGDGMWLDGVRYFALPSLRRQLEAEIRAQFAAFARTGLVLDHVNAHKHFHLHPTLLRMIVRIGREFGMGAVRVPREPLWYSAGRRSAAGGAGASRGGGHGRGGAGDGGGGGGGRTGGGGGGHGGVGLRLSTLVANAFLLPWVGLMKARLRAGGIAFNDQVFGLSGTGRLDEEALLDILAKLPPGVTEIYLHPAVDAGAPITSTMSEYRHSAELAALLSPRVADAVAATGAARGGYRDAWCELGPATV
ncbi:MAG TPA: hopanoid biosynthesis-associated protein HpnK, partial [Steroidobacteraceae bacterium]